MPRAVAEGARRRTVETVLNVLQGGRDNGWVEDGSTVDNLPRQRGRAGFPLRHIGGDVGPAIDTVGDRPDRRMRIVRRQRDVTRGVGRDFEFVTRELTCANIAIGTKLRVIDIRVAKIEP